jgi:GntP family gluconate:H+ symporter
MLKVGLPISLLLLIIAYAYMLRLPAGEGKRTEGTPPEISRTRAWAPLLLPIFLVLLGALGQARLLGNPSVALLLGSLLCLAMARSRIEEMVSTASRRSGVILLDLCGAGAFGYVVAQSGLGQALYGSLGKAVPLLLLPFLISSLLQLAQGSRVVTVVIAAQMLRDYPLDGITLSLLICAGAFMLSYVSDPYFWLVRESTGSSMREMLLGYTLPLSLLGMAAFVYAIIYNIMII